MKLRTSIAEYLNAPPRGRPEDFPDLPKWVTTRAWRRSPVTYYPALRLYYECVKHLDTSNDTD